MVISCNTENILFQFYVLDALDDVGSFVTHILPIMFIACQIIAIVDMLI